MAIREKQQTHSMPGESPEELPLKAQCVLKRAQKES